VDARKRAFVIVFLALAMREDAASEGMRVLTFVPGVANGALPVVLDLGSSPPPAELFVNGRAACRVTAVRQTCVVDLGPAPRVTLLELVRRDGSGQVVERARRWVNKPSNARAEVLVRSDCTRASGPCTLTFTWSHENAIAPRELTVTIDGARVFQGEPRDVPVPYAAGSSARIVSVDLVFNDDERATRTLLIGSSVSSAVEAPLNAVPVLSDGPAARDPTLLKTLGGRIVHTVEPGEMEVLFVVAPSAAPKLQALTRAAQKSFSRNAARMSKLFDGVSHILYFSPLATRGAFSSAARISDRMYRLQGFDCTPKHGHLEHTLALPCVDASLLSGEQYRLAATVASAAFNRAAVPRRRAVVVVLGDEERARDESPYGPADARRYLADIFVPLEVWRLGRAAGGEWPAGRRLSNADDLVRGWEALRAGLDAERICWIAEDLDPTAFRLGPGDEGLALAGRPPAASLAESEVVSSGPASLPAGDEGGAPGLVGGTRKSIVEHSSTERMTDQVVSNLFGRIPSLRRPIEARATATVPAQRGRVRVLYEVTIPAANLAFLPVAERRVARVAAFVAVLDGGDVTTAAPVRREFRTGEDVFADAEGRYVFTGEAVVARGSTISIGILDETSKEAGFGRIEVGATGSP